jgi:starch-binding outer membrane protein, SusD/RagB family
MKARYVFLAASLGVASCSEPTVGNYNSPTVEAAGKDPSSLQLQATGLLSQQRAPITGMTSDFGIFGRESFNYFPTDGRSHTHYVFGPGPLDYSGFAAGGGVWNAAYNNKRNIINFLAGVAAAPITQAQKDASQGFAKTLDALGLLYVIASRDTVGAITTIDDDPKILSPFVSRDSVYRFISAQLDEADADLAAAGTGTFPFALTAGFAGFSTPATFRQFNRAIAARALAYRGSLAQFGVPAGAPCTPTPCYAQALTALAGSFLSTAAGTAAALSAGPFHTYSTSSGDAQNTLFFSTTSDIVAHPSTRTDAALQAGGSRDARLLAKVDTLTPEKQPNAGPTSGISSTLRFKFYPDRNAGIRIIRNEELILLRAEARWFTGDKTNALVDLNFVRTNSGGLPASTLTIAATDAQFIDALLYERRYSLLFEGHRWVDHRRFNRLSQLPLDQPNHWVAKVQPVTQAECLIRVNQATPEMRGPGCP